MQYFCYSSKKTDTCLRVPRQKFDFSCAYTAGNMETLDRCIPTFPDRSLVTMLRNCAQMIGAAAWYIAVKKGTNSKANSHCDVTGCNVVGMHNTGAVMQSRRIINLC